ncbi:cytidine deaminase [Candidatus Woesearchaeota archaeon]|nr:cytidine deaminase [Candidatus Woesearchaeota archaeon]
MHTAPKYKITKEQIDKLIKNAITVQKNAYVPVTEYGVGACVLTEDDKFFKGCNVQSVISGLGTCAERNAIDNAITNKQYKFKAIAIASKDGVAPCGMCLQYLNEFSEVSKKDIIIICTTLDKKIVKKTTLLKTVQDLYGPEEGKKDLTKYKK